MTYFTREIKMVRTLALIAVVVVAALASTFVLAEPAATAPPVAPPLAIEGNYKCLGENPGGKPGYQGVVEVSKKKDVYVVKWTIGKSVHEGSGILNGNMLSVGYKSPDGPGVAVYMIEKTPDGNKMAGQWTSHPSDGVILKESWTVLK